MFPFVAIWLVQIWTEILMRMKQAKENEERLT